MKPITRALAFLLVLTLSAACTAAGDKVTGIYSNMVYNNEGGDVLGTEIFVVNANRGYYVVFQSSEGEPAPPVVIPAKIDGTSVSFTLPADVDPRGTFTGKVDAKGITGSFSGGNRQTVTLPRKGSYWQ